MKEADIIAILKPGKSEDNPRNYRLISLLSIMYKLMERIILKHIKPLVEKVIPAFQAGFQPKRGFCDQVLANTSYLEKGYNDGVKSRAAFINLSAVYDTVWKHGLLLKLSGIYPCKLLLRFLENSLGNRNFKVFLGDQTSRSCVLNNRLPQGSVLAPVLFNIYTHDLPETTSKKFVYADDICLATQSKKFDTIEHTLEEYLYALEKYFKKWRRKPNPSKTVVSSFHQNNRMANQKLTVNFCDQPVRHNPLLAYLDVTLTYKEHLKKVASKVKTRSSLISKLTGITCGASTQVLRTSMMALAYSVAEYCAQVWEGTHHCNLVDVELRKTMRIISRTVRSTPTQWLPVLADIELSHIKTQNAVLRAVEKIASYITLPIHEYGVGKPRLKSRHPFLERVT